MRPDRHRLLEIACIATLGLTGQCFAAQSQVAQSAVDKNMSQVAQGAVGKNMSQVAQGAVDEKIPHALPSISATEFHQAALRNPPQRSTAAQVAEWIKSKEAILIDLNSADEFAVTHLEGALNLPATELTDEALAALVPDKSTRLVLYCSDTLYPTRRVALTTIGAPAFIQLGYKNTTLLEPLYLSSDCKAANKMAKAPSVCGDLLPLFRAEELRR
jgi:Rhodanese-like domain